MSGSGEMTPVESAVSVIDLKTQIERDLDLFVDSDTFGLSAEFTHSETVATIKGIFSDSFKFIEPATGKIESSAPQILCKASDVSMAIRGDTIEINSVIYNVISIQPSEDKMMTTLILSRDEA